MAEPLLQSAFVAGELSPDMYGRVDLAHYQLGVRLARNFFVDYHGGLSNRTGSEMVAETKDSAKKAVLIPFTFSRVQTYMLEFGDGYMRVFRGGGLITETAVSISNITQASPAVVTTSTGHGYSTGDHVYISGVNGMLRVNGGAYVITVTSSTEFELDGVDSTAFEAYDSGGEVARVYEIDSPYGEDDLDRLKYTQSADVLTVTHPDYDPREVTRSGHTSWTITQIAFSNSVAVPANVSSTKSGFSASGHTVRYKVTAVVNGEESLPSSETSQDVEYPWPSGGLVELSWDSVTNAEYYVIYANKNGFWGFIGESEHTGGGAGAESFRDDNIQPEITDAPPADRDPFSGADDNPQTVTYHKQRIIYAGADNFPAGLEFSKIGFFKNFARSVPPKDDDAISYQIVSQEVNEVRHIVSLRNLIVLTSGAEWIITGDQAGTIAPGTIGADAQSYNGCSHLRPLVVGNTLLYVQDGGRTVRDLAYELNVDGLNGTDVTVRASHLFRGREIVSWCYAKEPYRVIWAVTDNGDMRSLTYVPDQKVWAWCRHDTKGAVESVASIREGNTDAVYAVVRRTIDGATRRYVERFHERDIDDQRDAFFVDSGLTFDGRNTDTGVTLTLSGGTDWEYFESVTMTLAGDTWTDVIVDDEYRLRREGESVRVLVLTRDSSTTATVRLLQDCPEALRDEATSDWDRAVKTLLGLAHLEGEDVSALADVNVEPTMTVSDGAVTLENHAAVIHVGLAITADVQTLDVEITDGTSTVRPRQKMTGKVQALVKDTRGLFVGQDEDNLVERKPMLPETYSTPIPLRTGVIETNVAGKWDKRAGMFLRQSDPLPCTLLSAFPEVVFGG